WGVRRGHPQRLGQGRGPFLTPCAAVVVIRRRPRPIEYARDPRHPSRRRRRRRPDGVSVNQHDLDVLDEIQRRVLWLATRIVDAANHDRDTGDGVKGGGHPAASAPLVTRMTARWFAHPGARGLV